MAIKCLLKNCTLLGCYTSNSGNFFIIPEQPIGPILKGQESMKMGLIGSPETSVSNYHCWLLNSPDVRSYHLLRGGSLKSRKMSPCCRGVSKIILYYITLIVTECLTLLKVYKQLMYCHIVFSFYPKYLMMQNM